MTGREATRILGIVVSVAAIAIGLFILFRVGDFPPNEPMGWAAMAAMVFMILSASRFLWMAIRSFKYDRPV